MFCAATTTTAANERKVSAAHPSVRILRGPQYIAIWACNGISIERTQYADYQQQLLSLGAPSDLACTGGRSAASGYSSSARVVLDSQAGS